MSSLRVLVTNAGRRKAIPIVRALGRAGMSVICADSSRLAPAFFSRHCRGWFVYPEPGSGRFLAAILKWLSDNPCDVVFPLDDDVLELLSENRRCLPNPAVLLLPDHDTVRLACDKSRLLSHATRVGIAVPHTVFLRDPEDLDCATAMRLPVVVKPSRGSGSRGVAFVKSRAQLTKLCRRALRNGQVLLVQEEIPREGEGLGYFALYDRSRRLVAQFMHRRLREYPLSGGPSTLREGIWDEKLAAEGRRLLESLKWVGVAMVEFKRDPRDGRPKLMEVNPRFWGSIALPIFSGVDFPVLAAKATVGEPTAPVTNYPVGRKARWLWPGDVLHLLASLRRGRWPKGFFSLNGRDTCDDLLSLRDPLPWIALTAQILLRVMSPKVWREVIFRKEPNQNRRTDQ